MCGLTASPLDALQEPINESTEQIDSVRDTPAKDFWDKVEASSTILGGALVAAIGGLATFLYNRRQMDIDRSHREQDRLISRVNTVGEFLPHLGGNDSRRTEAALVALAELGNEDLATRLAVIYSREGGAEALARLAEAGSEESSSKAGITLGELRSTVVASLVKVGDPIAGTGFFVPVDGQALSDVVVTAAHVVRPATPGAAVATTLADGSVSSGILILLDETHDLALIRVPIRKEPAIFQRADTASSGDRVQLVYFGPSEELRWQRGELLGPANQSPDADVVIGLTTSPGASGGPVLDSTGNVIAMLHMSDKRIRNAFAVSSASIVRALRTIEQGHA